eukprot:12930842-Prorocentrum_lima.AAC.1
MPCARLQWFPKWLSAAKEVARFCGRTRVRDLLNKLASDNEPLSPEQIAEIEEKLRVGCGRFADWW